MVTPVLLAVGAIIVFETTGELDTSTGRVAATTTSVESTFTTDPAAGSWENWDSGGDNQTMEWDNIDVGYLDNMVEDNLGGTSDNTIAPVGYWYQNLTVPTYNGVTTASVAAKWQLCDNTLMENLWVYVILGRPGGDNVIIYNSDNDNIVVADNTAWFTVDNNVTTHINSAGVYTIYLQDNCDRSDDCHENFVSVRWDNASLSVTTYVAGYAENAVTDVEEQAESGYTLGSLLPIIIAAIALITIIIAGFIGTKGVSRFRK